MSTPLNSTQLTAVRDALRGGDRIAAIKLYRECTGAGLAEAKAAVEALELTGSLPAAASASGLTGLSADLMAQLQEALFQGRKIEAIKRYRGATNQGLKESKDAVEKMEAELRQRSPERFSAKASGKGCTGVLLLMVTAMSVLLVLLAKR
jgi:ribosomal protein L7/L12